MPLSLIDFWPAEQNITECIRPEAETATEAVFLAVHRPMTFMKRSTTDHSSSEECGQEELLADFLREDLPSGTLLLPIIGNSGVGKSHMIRWLDAELRRRDDAEKRHIIRIPKSSSLKQVLHIILDDLKGPAYEEIREDLKAARDHIDPNTAAEELRAKILAALEKKAMAARDRLERAHKQGEKPDRKDRAVMTHAGKNGLQAFFSDPVIAKNFMHGDDGTPGIIAQIAERVTQGWRHDDEVRNQFAAEDFVLNEQIDLSQASTPAQNYHGQISRMTRSDELAKAVRILNDVIDDAIYQLLDLGDHRLTELFIRVREELLKEGRELVLLVEDFVALAGVQGALLDVMKQEAVRDGEQVCCTMRTALAVTEGYLANRSDTVTTRAEYEWVIDETWKSEDGVLDEIVDLVGGYLNAARLGEDTLVEQYSRSGAGDSESWVPHFGSTQAIEPEVDNQLSVFGQSSDGNSLFPLNRASIRQLADQYLRDDDDELRYNPRLVLNKLLRDTLRDYRSDFKKGEFPSHKFRRIGRDILDAQVRDEVYDRCSGKQEADQAIGLLALWGGNPSTWNDAESIPAELYEVFSVPVLTKGTKQVDLDEDAPGTSASKESGSNKPDRTREKSTLALGESEEDSRSAIESPSSGFEYHPDEDEWNERLNNWAAGDKLIQSKARKLREWIAESLYHYIDEDLYLLRNARVHDRYFKMRIYIPGADGGANTCDAENAMVTVCRERDRMDDRRSAKIVLTLMAIVRQHLYESWDYPGADKDMMRYASFMERVAPQAVEFYRSRYFEVEADTVTAMGQALFVAARTLDLPNSHASEHVLLLNAIFQDVPNTKIPQSEEDSRWSQLRSKCWQIFDSQQGNFRELLLEQVGARQGGGSTVRAIDAAQLLDVLEKIQPTWRVADLLPRKAKGEYGQIYKHFSELRRNLDSGIRERRETLEEWYTATRAWLGDSPDKGKIADQMRDTVTKTHTATVHRGPGKNTIHRLIRDFRNSAVNTVVADVQRLIEADEPGFVLSIVARADNDVIASVETLRRTYGEFLDKTSAHIDSQLEAIGADVVERAVDEIEEELEQLSEILEVLPAENAAEEEMEPA